ncbi:hypothetical protein HDU92_004654 [Lobulomyces angularis]|nr:hypothetical protein HDU92_004654 [Lobulomyces angularis]
MGEKKKKQSEQLGYFDGLRGFAALQVLGTHFQLYHYDKQSIFTEILVGNNLAVTIFFILSGRLLSQSIIRSPTSKTLGSVFVRRPFRLVIPVFGAIIMSQILYYLGMFNIDASKVKSIDGQQIWGSERGWHKKTSDGRKLNFGKILWYTFSIFILKVSTFGTVVHWTMPMEFFGSYFTFLVTMATQSFSGKGKAVLYSILFFFPFWKGDWNGHFVVGIILAELALGGFYNYVNRQRWAFLFHLSLTVFPLLTLFGHKPFQRAFDSFYSKNYMLGYNGIGTTNPDKMGGCPSLEKILVAVSIIMLLEVNSVVQYVFSVWPMILLGKASFGLYLLHEIWFSSGLRYVAIWISTLKLTHYDSYFMLYYLCFITMIPMMFVFYHLFDKSSIWIGNFVYSVLVNGWKENKIWPESPAKKFKRWGREIMELPFQISNSILATQKFIINLPKNVIFGVFTTAQLFVNEFNFVFFGGSRGNYAKKNCNYDSLA